MALIMSNAGGAWDNAMKYVESGYHGGKGSAVHSACVLGDPVRRSIQGHLCPIYEHHHQRHGDCVTRHRRINLVSRKEKIHPSL